LKQKGKKQEPKCKGRTKDWRWAPSLFLFFFCLFSCVFILLCVWKEHNGNVLSSLLWWCCKEEEDDGNLSSSSYIFLLQQTKWW
jgi:hypothetical protein